jgi:hypothetical protein
MIAKPLAFYMYSLITKSAVLLAILTLLPLANASAELKKVPLILMDSGNFRFKNNPPTIAELNGTGTSTHLGKIESTGEFENVGNRRSGGFKGEIEGTASAVAIEEMATATATATSTATGTGSGAATATASPTPNEDDSITYRLSAEFFPGGVPGVFYGIGTYRITGGSGAFTGARGFGVFIGLADLREEVLEYNCFLKGTISY